MKEEGSDLASGSFQITPGGSGASVVATLVYEVPAAETLSVAVDGRKTMDLKRGSTDFGTVRQNVRLHAGDSFRIGRSRDNELVLLGSDISRHHAVMSASLSGVVLSDLSSLNGTYVNGERISAPVDLKSGDKIVVGRMVCRITLHLASQFQDLASESNTQCAPMAPVVITLLVSDIKGYTKLSQLLPAIEVTNMLDRWFGHTTDIIRRNGGIVDKFIGDCVMAFWVEEDRESSEGAIKATLAASQIAQATAELASSGVWPYNNSHPWRCRTILNTGEALMGAVGGKAARDFTVLGDAVNLTFRLEKIASAKDISIMLSSSTAKLICNHLAVKSLGVVSVDGRPDKVEVFCLA